MIEFNKIPPNLRVPGTYTEFDNSQAVTGLSDMPTSLLVIGQKLAAGTQPVLVPVGITSKDQAKLLFGAGSQLAHMLEKLLDANNFIETYAVAQLDNAGGAAAAGAVTFAGPSTAAGTLYSYIGARRFTVGVTSAMTAAQAATAYAAAVNAAPDLAVTAAVDGVVTSKVNLTAKHKGVEANAIDIRFNYEADEFMPAGLSATITAMTGGSGNPDVTSVIAAIGDTWFTDVAMAYSDNANIAAMEQELEDRFGPLRQIDGHLYVGSSITFAGLITKGQSRNSPHTTILGSYLAMNPPYEWAAVAAVQAAFALHLDPARPLTGIKMTGIRPPDDTALFKKNERNLLLYGGISTFIVEGGDVEIERLISTYRTNPYGASDPSYLDITTLKTLAFLRYDLNTFMKLRFPRFKLADDGTAFARGENVATPSVIRAAIVARAREWEEAGLVEDIEGFINTLIVERDGTDKSRVNIRANPNIVNGLLVLATQIQFVL